jgi:hypothetical protein
MPDVDDMFDSPEPAPRRQAQPSQTPPAPQRRPAPAPGRPQPQQAAKPAAPAAKPAKAAPPAPAAAAPAPLPAPAESAPSERLPEAIEKQAAEVIEGILSGAIMGGDEPEDVIQQIAGKFPEDWLKILANYDLNAIFGRIREIQPNSAVLTPGGATFTKETFKQLRQIL